MGPSRCSLLALCAIACGHGAGPSTTFRAPPRLPPPPPSDPAAFGHAYLEKVGGRLQGNWAAFLEDVRLRLPPTDPLNDGRLRVVVDCQIAADGSVGAVQVAPSGNPSFDRAALEVLRDAAPLAPPPAELRSDDDTVHLHWAFARDRRQAGAAGARIERVEWPVERAVPKLLGAGQLAEAARRVAKAGDVPARGAIAERVFVAAIVEGLASNDVSIRRDAAAALEAAGGRGLAAQARELARDAVDADVRGHAVAALGALGPDADARAILVELLAQGPELPRPLVATIARALAAQGPGGADDVVQAARGWLAAPAAPAVIGAALAALSAVAAPPAIPAVRALAASRDPIVRGAACGALAPSAATPGAWAAIQRGLADADATVRAACTAAAATAAAPAPRAATARITASLRDPDERVRAAAAVALATLAGARAAGPLAALPSDKSAAVRAALAAAWGRAGGSSATAALRALAGDGDAAVRAAAVAALAASDDADARALAARLAPDPDPRVRLAAVAAIADVDLLAGLVADDDPQVRTAALDRDARLRGRAAVTAARAAALAAAPRGSADAVRIARSWLLAR